jgi:uncharacterized membrane protein YdjX (TVP38/TMEM64 family)
MSNRWIGAAKFAVAVLVLGVMFIWIRSSPFAEHFRSVTAARRFVESMQPYDKAGFVAAYIVGAPFLPGTLLSFVGAILFGMWWGTLLAWIGASAGSLAPYLFARFVGRSAMETLGRSDGDALGRFETWIADRGFSGLLLVRFLPIFPFVFVNYACGLVGIRFRDYLLATAIGILPGTFVYQYLFASLGEKVLDEGLQWSYLTDRNVLLPIGAFIVFLLLGRRLAAAATNSRSTPAGESVKRPPSVDS